MIRSNAWITLEKVRALSWRDWRRWYESDQSESEPPLTNFEKKAVLRLIGMEFLFKKFLRPTIATRDWIMISVYDVTEREIQAGYNQLGEAPSGDFALAGYWIWQPGQSFCQFQDLGYPWLSAQVLKFMPPTYDDQGQAIPASGVRDVNLIMGQPPREFPV